MASTNINMSVYNSKDLNLSKLYEHDQYHIIIQYVNPKGDVVKTQRFVSDNIYDISENLS